MKENTKLDFVLTAVFICLLLSFLTFFLTNTVIRQESDIAPCGYDGTVVSESGLFGEFERAVYQRESFLSMIRKCEYGLFGILHSNNVVSGRNDFLFEVEDTDHGYNYFKDYLGQQNFSEDEMAAILSELNRRRDSYAARGTEYLLAVIPNSQTVYSEYMPAWFGQISGNTRLGTLDRYLSEHGFCNYIDVTADLMNVKDEGELYNNTENSLNALGLYYTYLSVSNCFSSKALDVSNVIPPQYLNFYQHMTPGKAFAREAGIANVAKNRTISLSNETLLNYRFQFNSGYVAQTVRLAGYHGVPGNSTSLLLQFTNIHDRLQIERFFSNTFDHVTYQPDLEDNAFVYSKASPSVVVQFIYENELSMLLPAGVTP